MHYISNKHEHTLTIEAYMAHTIPSTTTEVLVEIGVTEEMARDGAYSAIPM